MSPSTLDLPLAPPTKPSKRRSRRILWVVAVVLALLTVAIGFTWRSANQERARIQSRYQQLRAALNAGDTNAVLALIAPRFRNRFDSHGFTMLDGFAQPLGPRSAIMVFKDEALVWPERTRHFVVIPGGDTIEMVRVGEDWFFTGEVHID